MDIIERDAADFFTVARDDQESAMNGEVLAICGNIDDPIHPEILRLFARPGVEHPAERVDADLAGLELFEAAGGG